MTTSKDAPDGTDHNAAQKTSQVSDCDISPSTTTASQNSAIPVSGREKLRLSSADMKAGFGIVAQQEQQQVPGNTSSWSASSDKQLYSSPRSSSDRVFPIRSVVGIDPTQTPYSFQGRSSGEHADYFAPGAMPVPVGRESNNPSRQNTASDAGNPAARVRRQMTEAQTTREAARRERRQSSAADGPQVGGTGLLLFRGTPGDGGSERSGTTTTHTGSAKASESVSIKSDSIGDRTTSTRNSLDANGSAYGLVTARFKHVVTADGHAVITGRDGETLQRCEDEPIHIPGAVQGFGLLVALVEDEQGHLVVRIVSENSARIIGYSPKELFALRSFTDILSEEQQVCVTCYYES